MRDWLDNSIEYMKELGMNPNFWKCLLLESFVPFIPFLWELWRSASFAARSVIVAEIMYVMAVSICGSLTVKNSLMAYAGLILSLVIGIFNQSVQADEFDVSTLTGTAEVDARLAALSRSWQQIDWNHHFLSSQAGPLLAVVLIFCVHFFVAKWVYHDGDEKYPI